MKESEPAYTYPEIVTLGPLGTCSQQIAEKYLAANHVKNGSNLIVLTDTFEKAIELAKVSPETKVLIPSAYRKFADIVFDNKDWLSIEDCFLSPTPAFIFMKRSGLNLVDIKSVASHATPVALLQEVIDTKKVEIFDASSNANAAEKLSQYLVDACLTVESKRTDAMLKSGYEIVKNFGGAKMSWNIFRNNKHLH